jgi:K+-transporting ATPase A subunit
MFSGSHNNFATGIIGMFIIRSNETGENKKKSKKQNKKKINKNKKKEDNIYTYLAAILALNAIIITLIYFFNEIPNFYPFEPNGFYIVVSWITFALINNKADYGTWTYKDKE